MTATTSTTWSTGEDDDQQGWVPFREALYR
jgi:hypothetical protein